MVIANITSFIEQVRNGESLTVSSHGSLTTRWKIVALLRRLFGWGASDDLAIARYFAQYLESFETTSARIRLMSHDGVTSEQIEAAANAVRARIQYLADKEERAIQPQIVACQAKKAHLLAQREQLLLSPLIVANALELRRAETQKINKQIESVNKQIIRIKEKAYAQNQLQYIERAMIGKKYRGMRQDAIYAAKPADFDQSVEWFKKELIQWKSTRFPRMDEIITPTDLAAIQRTCYYPEIVKLAKRDYAFFDGYCKSVFFNTKQTWEQRVDVAIQTPASSDRLSKGFLDKRHNVLNNDLITFSEQVNADGSIVKQTSLKINKTHYSMANLDQEVAFAVDDKTTVNEILQSFAGKNVRDMGEYETFQDGVLHFHPKQPDIDLNGDDWWMRMPVLLELTKQEAEARYGTAIPEGQAILSVNATRQNLGLTAEGNHAFLEAAIPQANGKYRIFPFGKYADKYPQGQLESFLYSFRTHRGTLCVDENIFYTHREVTRAPIFVDQEHINRFFAKVKEDLIKVHNNALVLQIQGNNCATWVQETLDRVFPVVPDPAVPDRRNRAMPNPFEEDLLNLKTTNGVVNGIMDVLSFLATNVSETAANVLRVSVAILCGACARYSYVENGYCNSLSLYDWDLWRSHRINLPAKLFDTVRDFTRKANELVHPPAAAAVAPLLAG